MREMTGNSDEIYEFDEHRLDVSERRLFRLGAEVPVTPKAFDLLTLLVRNQGHLLTKDRILEELWAGSFVEEANLNVNISALRRVLGDNAAEQRFIETVPRQGYRFVAEVTDISGVEDATTTVDLAEPVPEKSLGTAYEGDSAIPSPAISSGSPRRIVLSLGAAVVLISVLSWFGYRSMTASVVRPRSIAVLPFKPLSQTTADEALELGMTDALITKLSKIDRLSVRPTSAVRRYAAENADPVSAGRELGVDTVLDGKVQKADNKIRELTKEASALTAKAADIENAVYDLKAVNPNAVVVVDEQMMTGYPGLFAGGDMVPSDRTVTIGVGHGKKAARNIDAWLRGGAYAKPPKHDLATFEKLHVWYYTDAAQRPQGHLDMKRRQSSFEEVVGGLSQKEALYEAKRCLSCGNCYECDGCYGACPEDAVVKLGPGKRYFYNYDLCTGCAVCFEQCPCHAIEMTPEPAAEAASAPTS